MKNFSVHFGGWKGTRVAEHRLALCLIPHFLYSSESTLTLKDVPSTLQSLVAVIAQHASQKAKLKGAGEGRSVLSVDYLLLNPEVFPHCVGVFQDVSVSKKRKRHLVCWNIIYVRFEKVVMAWV